MAGHSKWKNIQHRKNAQDASRGKIFTKLIREITTAAKMGGGDPNGNPRLRLAIDKALTNNMTKDTITRAIKRGAGDGDDTHLEEIVYEGYGPAGVAVLIECLTDNKNRTVADVRHVFTKWGGNLGATGSVSYLFSKIGCLQFEKGNDEEKIMFIALEKGANDIKTNEDGSINVITTPENFIAIKDAFIQANLHPMQAEITMSASTQVTVIDEDQIKQILKLLDNLEELDDVQNVYANADIIGNIG